MPPKILFLFEAFRNTCLFFSVFEMDMILSTGSREQVRKSCLAPTLIP